MKAKAASLKRSLNLINLDTGYQEKKREEIND